MSSKEQLLDGLERLKLEMAMIITLNGAVETRLPYLTVLKDLRLVKSLKLELMENLRTSRQNKKTIIDST